MEIINVKLTEYVKDKHEYKGLLNGETIIIDPYVGCAWDDKHVELGDFKFKGHWFKECFLVDSQIK